MHANHRVTNRAGFTLVELLVVIAIIGILVALLLPAIQAAREASRRAQCGSNLKQLGVALQNYHDSYRKLPPGALWSGTNPYRGSMLVHLLPFVEQQAVYDLFNFSVLTDGQTTSGGVAIGSLIVPVYVCPSDTNTGLLNGLAIHNYTGSRGATALIDNPAYSCPSAAGWNAYALCPYDNASNYCGPFTRMSVCIALRDVTDGLSTTIFMGEVRRACSGHTQAGWATSNDGNGLAATIIPINVDSCHTAGTGCDQPWNWNNELGFKSLHPGGCQFVFGDGAVHYLAESIDHWNYQYLGSSLLGFTGPLTYVVGGAMDVVVRDPVVTAKGLLLALHLIEARILQPPNAAR